VFPQHSFFTPHLTMIQHVYLGAKRNGYHIPTSKANSSKLMHNNIMPLKLIHHKGREERISKTMPKRFIQFILLFFSFHFFFFRFLFFLFYIFSKKIMEKITKYNSTCPQLLTRSCFKGKLYIQTNHSK